MGSITSIPSLSLSVTIKGTEYRFVITSDAQGMLLQGFFTRFLDAREFTMRKINGEEVQGRGIPAPKKRKVVISYKDERPDFVVYASTNDDLDMLTCALQATAGDGVTLRQYVQLEGKWMEREPGAMYRKSIVSVLRGMPAENVDVLLRFAEMYQPYLKQMLTADRGSLLAGLGIM